MPLTDGLVVGHGSGSGGSASGASPRAGAPASVESPPTAAEPPLLLPPPVSTPPLPAEPGPAGEPAATCPPGGSWLEQAVRNNRATAIRGDIAAPVLSRAPNRPDPSPKKLQAGRKIQKTRRLPFRAGRFGPDPC